MKDKDTTHRPAVVAVITDSNSALLVRRLPMFFVTAVVAFLTICSKPDESLISHASQASAVLVQDTQRRVEAELITIQPNGFEPSEISRPKGRFLLGIDNRSGSEQIQLRLELTDGARVPALESRNRRLSWREEVDFPPGQYVIKEMNHPEWSCLITITAR
jgi:hypothetical protein